MSAMEDSPKTDPSKAGKAHEQKAENAPKSGERPDQGKAPAPDHYRTEPQDTHVHAHIPAPDVATAKYRYPILEIGRAHV